MNRKTVYKGVSMLRRLLAFITVGFVAVMEADFSEKKMAQIQKSIDNILAKAGISFGGEFKSQYFLSQLGGEGVDSLKRSSETNEFTSVDFDIKARPNEMIGGHLIFRMHQNWQNFFSDVSNPIFSRWISIDGNIKDMIRFNVGDFKLKYSPLTIWAPDIEIMNEPYIFARQRQLAMDEFFLEDNNRIFQGLNFGFDAEIAPIFNEFHFGLVGVRLRSRDVAFQDGDKSVMDNEAFPFSKFLTGANLDLTFLKGINLGGTWLYTFDHRSSASNKSQYEVNAQHTSVFSFRPGVDIGKFTGSEKLSLALNAEIAVSNDDSAYISTVETVVDTLHETVSGMAFHAGVQFSFNAGDNFNISVNPSFITNNELFRNDLAQSPYFYGNRIMNTENDSITKVTKTSSQNTTTTTITSEPDHYSTFDALYHSVFKFVPSAETNKWAKAPYMKTSYSRNIMTQDEMDSNSIYLDPALQLVMPYGAATANRKGLVGDLNIGLLNNGINLDIDLKLLSEVKSLDSYLNPAAFKQIGLGAKVDFSKFIEAIKYPLEISGSISTSGASGDSINGVHSYDITSNLINAGLYAKFYKNAAVIAGLQMISNEATQTAVAATSSLSQIQWALGLEWKVNSAADVVGTIGKAILDYEGTTFGVVPNDVARLHLRDFDTWLVDLSLRVKF